LVVGKPDKSGPASTWISSATAFICSYLSENWGSQFAEYKARNMKRTSVRATRRASPVALHDADDGQSVVEGNLLDAAIVSVV